MICSKNLAIVSCNECSINMIHNSIGYETDSDDNDDNDNEGTKKEELKKVRRIANSSLNKIISEKEKHENEMNERKLIRKEKRKERKIQQRLYSLMHETNVEEKDGVVRLHALSLLKKAYYCSECLCDTHRSTKLSLLSYC